LFQCRGATQDSRDDPFGQRSLLPRVFCAAEYWSPTPVPAEETWSESYLVLVWWQDDWALPVDAGVLEDVRRHAWQDVAYGWFD